MRTLAVATVGLFAFLFAGGTFAYNALQGNITTTDVTSLLGEDRPTFVVRTPPGPADPSSGRPVNILVMGSDVRDGANAAYGADIEGMRSDTTLLVHISADRNRADIVSIPRDLLVDVPECRLADGSTSYPQSSVMFNSAFATGGTDGDVAHAAACAIRTVEQLTGVYIDDYVVVDFTGFIEMVDALGGVPMCIPEDMRSEQADLDLSAGQQVLDGHDALAYARARKNVGDGSDISRINRQQLLLGAMVRQVLSKNLLTDLPALYQFLDAATRSLTAGEMIGRIPQMVGLANSLRELPAGGVSFVTVPFEWAGARVVPTAASEELWDAIAADEPIAPEKSVPTGAATESSPDEAPAESAGGTEAVAPGDDQPWAILTGEDEAGICG